MEFLSNSLGQPLADESLIRNRLHSGDLAECLDLGRIELDRNILKPASSLAGEYLAAQLFIQRELNRAVLNLFEHAMTFIVISGVFLDSCRVLSHGSMLPLTEVVNDRFRGSLTSVAKSGTRGNDHLFPTVLVFVLTA